MIGVILAISTLIVFIAIIPFLPVPSFLLNMPSYTFPPELMYFLQPFQFDVGLAVIVSAYSMRFLRKLLVKA